MKRLWQIRPNVITVEVEGAIAQWLRDVTASSRAWRRVMTTIGVVALLLGVLLIVVEAHAPTAGLLGALGALMIGAGVWMLFTSDGIGQSIAIPVTAGSRWSAWAWWRLRAEKRSPRAARPCVPGRNLLSAPTRPFAAGLVRRVRSSLTADYGVHEWNSGTTILFPPWVNPSS
ncbi:hypothetical protein GCM10020255_037450 [Rhodococcus baikonurensis]